MRREWLALMAKAPVAGEVKTRLKPALGPDRAAVLYSAFLQDTVATMRRVAESRPSVRLALCAAGLRPDKDVFADVDLTGFWLLAQLGSSLGARLEVCFDVLFVDRKADAVVVLGADSPSLPADYVTSAFAALEEGNESRVVLGPADDGGYYLLGTNSLQPCLFDEIAWGTESVKADTLRAAASKGLEVKLLADWYDVDTEAELERLRLELILSPESAPHTAAVLTGL